MKPFIFQMVGYVMDEVQDFYHGRWLGDQPTLLLRVYYPMKKPKWDRTPDRVASLAKRTRCFPFIIHPKRLDDIKALGSLKGQFVVVSFYLDTNEQGKTIRVIPYAVRVENIVDGYPGFRIVDDKMEIPQEIMDTDFDYGQI